MKKILLSFSLALCLSQQAFAQTAPFIDASWRSSNLSMRSEEATRCVRMAIIRKLHCRADIRKEYEARGLVPGTEQYIQKNYGGMSIAQINNVIRKINSEYLPKVRNVDSTQAVPGEITRPILEADMGFLEHLINLKGGQPNPFDQFMKGK
ncbi:hypothetical protein [Acetobacter persici]|uniref:hypothetical protein n=1 Tax=Acetobacter persici TaxID=1076596 RepID=UPI0011775F6E|nr:hypothetical protein [Acetobacter persici]